MLVFAFNIWWRKNSMGPLLLFWISGPSRILLFIVFLYFEISFMEFVLVIFPLISLGPSKYLFDLFLSF
jgi:hypothetical protein